jgi:hypothetical protein
MGLGVSVPFILQLTDTLTSAPAIINKPDDCQYQTKRYHGDIYAERPAVARFVVLAKYLRAIYAGGISAHYYPVQRDLLAFDLYKRPREQTYMAIASARSSESVQVRDIHAIFSG